MDKKLKKHWVAQAILLIIGGATLSSSLKKKWSEYAGCAIRH